MKAAAAGNPGEVVLRDFPEPVPADGDLVIAALACGVCATDLKIVQKGSQDPRYALGHELVGRVLRAPAGSPWSAGQRVALAPYLPCGRCYYCQRGQLTLCTDLYKIYYAPGGLSERVLVPRELAARGMLPVPDALGDDLAALAEPLGCVIKGLEDSRFQPGESLLVIGDGPMGQLAAAAGKALGANPVIVVGMTAHRLAVARENFAGVVVDASQADPRPAVLAATGQRGADAVIVAVSGASALETGIRCVRAGGEVNMFAGVPDGTEIRLDVRRLHYQQYHLTGSTGTTPRHMQKAIELMAGRAVDFSPVISARFPFEDAAGAVRHMQTSAGLKSVVIFPKGGG